MVSIFGTLMGHDGEYFLWVHVSSGTLSSERSESDFVLYCTMYDRLTIPLPFVEKICFSITVWLLHLYQSSGARNPLGLFLGSFLVPWLTCHSFHRGPVLIAAAVETIWKLR